MDVPARIAFAPIRQRPHQRHERVRRRIEPFAQPLEGKVLHPGLPGDLLGGLARDQSHSGLRPGQRGLHLKQMLDVRLVGKDLPHPVIGERSGV
jgi:hypothetical protein